MAKLPSGVQRHRKTGMFWVRRVVPPELRPFIGKREITRTLGTKDAREMKRRYPRAMADVEEVLDKARQQLNAERFLQDQLEAGDALADRQAAFEASLTPEQRELGFSGEAPAAWHSGRS